MARAQKEAEQQADDIVTSLSHASEAAVDTAMNQIEDKLRINIPLLYHLWALLHNEEWTAVLIASMSAKRPDQNAATSQALAKRKLRNDIKRIGHLTRRTRG